MLFLQRSYSKRLNVRGFGRQFHLHRNNGTSVVDYMICSSEIFDSVTDVRILRDALSVHFPLKCSLSFRLKHNSSINMRRLLSSCVGRPVSRLSRFCLASVVLSRVCLASVSRRSSCLASASRVCVSRLSRVRLASVSRLSRVRLASCASVRLCLACVCLSSCVCVCLASVSRLSASVCVRLASVRRSSCLASVCVRLASVCLLVNACGVWLILCRSSFKEFKRSSYYLSPCCIL